MGTHDGWGLRPIGDFLTESRIPGTDGTRAKKLSVKLYGNGVVPKQENRPGSKSTKYYVRRAGQFIYSKLDFLNGAFGIIPEELDGYESTLDLPAFDLSGEINPQWLLTYVSRERFYSAQLGLAKGGRKARRVSPREFLRIKIPVPPRREQDRIAEILGSVDEVIQATRAVIEQTRMVKQGMLEELLMRGIGHTRFKQTEIGELPEGWEVVRLDSLLADIDNPMRSGPFGSALRKNELVPDGIPLLGIDNVHRERFVKEYKRFVTPQKFCELDRYAVRPGDVMITIMGTVGRCCVVPDDVGKALSSKHVWTITLDQSRYRADLLCLQLNYAAWTLKHFGRAAQGGVMDAISSSTLKSTLLPCPAIEEQHQIADALELLNESISAAEQKQSALEMIKWGLVQELFSTRRRRIIGI